MIVSWPAQVKPGVSDALVSQIDLYASMASLMGKPLEEGPVLTAGIIWTHSWGRI